MERPCRTIVPNDRAERSCRTIVQNARAERPCRTTVLNPPVPPMLAKLADTIPDAGEFLFEPKWDGFRSIVFRGQDDLYIQSRDLKPLDRYFPELHDALL